MKTRHYHNQTCKKKTLSSQINFSNLLGNNHYCFDKQINHFNRRREVFPKVYVEGGLRFGCIGASTELIA